TARNAVVIRGSSQQVVDVKAALNAYVGEGMGGGQDKTSGKTRIIDIGKGSPSALANYVKEAFEKMRGNPIKVINPTMELFKEEKKPEPNKDKPEKKAGVSYEISRYYAAQVDPQDQEKQPEKKVIQLPGKEPVTIVVSGGKIIVTSEDPEAVK